MAEDNLETPMNAASAPVTDPGTVPASPDVSQVVDPSVSLNQHLQSQFGMTIDDVKNLRSGMNQAQREAAELKRRFRDVEPLIEAGERDPNFLTHLYEQARTYGSDSGGGVDPTVLRALDPIQRDLRRTNSRLDAWEYNQQMGQLVKDFPDFMTPEVQSQLSINAEATGNYDLEYQLFKQYGRTIMTKAHEKGTKDAVKVIQDNNKLYATGVTTTAVAPSTPVEKMNDEQKVKWVDSELDHIMSDPDYAAKIAREVG